MSDLAIGQTIETADGRQGVVRFLGSTHFAAGEWVGLELGDALGKNNGSVQGQQYFECDANHGLFLRPEGVAQILEQPTPRPPQKGNGNAANGHARGPRPSSGILGEAARKRQSIMSGGSTPGSRLSMRSPTKSPTKPLSSTPSSALSTPRTGTPSTAARTSSSSAKSRTSTGPRMSMAPPKAPGKAVPSTNGSTRQSLSGGLQRGATPNLRSNDPSSRRLTQSSARPTISKTAAATRDKKAPEEQSSHQEDRQELRGKAPAEPGLPQEEAAARSSGLPTDTSAPVVEKLQREIEELNEDKAKLSEANLRLSATVKAVESKMKTQRNELGGLKRSGDDKARLEKQIEELQEKVKSQQKQCAELIRDHEQLKENNENLEIECQEFQYKQEEAFEHKLQAEERASNFERELEAVEHIKNQLQREIDQRAALEAELEDPNSQDQGSLALKKEIRTLESAIEMMRDRVIDAENEQSKCLEEHQSTLDDFEVVKTDLDKTKLTLSETEAVKQTLKEQVDALESAAEDNEELFEKVEEMKTQIEVLKNELEDAKDAEEVNNDIHQQYVEEFQRFNDELESRTEMLNESIHARDRAKRDLEDQTQVLEAFKAVLNEYQEKESELQNAQADIQPDELGKKSRELLDLNLKLQSTNAKSQARTIDFELGKLRAEESTEHLSILKLFLPSTFEPERNPILALLSFRRIAFKARMIRTLLREKFEDSNVPSSEDKFTLLEIVEKLSKVLAMCECFVSYIDSCPEDEFLRFESVVLELEPVDRNLNMWVEELRSGNLKPDRYNTEVSGISAIFNDLIEKLLPSTAETRSNSMSSNAILISTCADHLGIGINILRSTLGAILLKTEGEQEGEGEEEMVILQRQLEQLTSKTKSIKALADKALKNLDELANRSLALGEEPGQEFENTEQMAQESSRFVRALGRDLTTFAGDDTRSGAPTPNEVLSILARSADSFLQSSAISSMLPAAQGDFAAALTQCLSLLSKKVETLAGQAGDHNLTSEFERNQHPWVARAQKLKTDKTLAPETEALIEDLRSGYERQSRSLSEKDSAIEQQRLRIEVLESRTKDSKEQAAIVRGLEAEIEHAKRERDETRKLYEATKAEYLHVQGEKDELQAQVEVMQQSAQQDGAREGISIMSARDQRALQAAQAELAELRTETTDLQAAIRFLREDNRRLRLPAYATHAAQHSWLSVPLISKPKEKEAERIRLATEDCEKTLDQLWQVTKEMKPVILKSRRQSKTTVASAAEEKKTTWRPIKDTPKYQVLKQKEEVARWLGVRDDLLSAWQGHPSRRPLKRGGSSIRMKADPGEGVQIVGSPP
ncbi:MAG: hypothetical protein Q9227_001060 [Pyrenula ochraceoflavens]